VGIGLGTILFYGWRWYAGQRRIRDFHLSTQDLNYSNQSPEELLSHHLLDLNTASLEEIAGLGISGESAERLLQNRPYPSKLDLISRMVLSQVEYESIKDRVSVAEAREPVKIG